MFHFAPLRLSSELHPLDLRLMDGVRLFGRGNYAPGPTFCPPPTVIAWLVVGSLLVAARSGQAEEPRRTVGQTSSARLPRSIRQTAGLQAEPDETPEPVPAPRARGGLTDPAPEIADLKEPLAGVVVEGNRTIAADEILKKIKTRAGRPPDPKQIKDDVRSLYSSRWFFNVETRLSQTAEGPVLVFKVLERPMLQKVEYAGNKKIKTKELGELTGLKVGGAYDVGANKESARRIENHYHEKGFIYAKVELEKGESLEDREVRFKINEGPKVHVDKISFSGNSFVSDGVLKTQVKTKTRLLWLFGGKYDPATVPEDIASLKQYYHSLGFFDVRIKNKGGVSNDKARVHLEYEIVEGPRYKVRNIEIVGNRVLPEDKLRTEAKMLPGQYFNERFLNADVEKITAQYGELGRIFARVEATPRFLEEPGTVDLVYNIDEDRPYRIGKIHVHIEGDHPHTKESVILTRLRIRPGELASREKIKKSEQSLRNSQIFAGALPGAPDGPRIAVAPAEPTRSRDEVNIVRGQNQNYGYDSSPSSPHFDDPPVGSEPLPGSGPLPLFEDQPPGFIEPHVYVQETQTGRLMFGVGVNSNAGFVGSAVLEENNFDLFRPPTSMADIFNGTAWRGGGQQFRIEAVPGNQLSRYLISWRDPYFMEQNFSLGASGFYYTRFFPNWREQRLGGRITVGQQFSPEFSGSMALRLENVDVTNPSIPTPPQLSEVLGNNFLSTVRASLAHDTRDSSFIPGKGHFIEASYEQGIADFLYPKLELDARQYFTLSERPDGGNRQIVSMVGQVGWTDNETPIFEKFFAGGFQSFRGFAFYGVSPRVNGIRIGGRWQALGSLEYMLPVTADDTIQLVAFTDMGTVEDRVAFEEFRLSVGAGVRLTIPAMGPVPIALDLGFPIIKQDFDDERIFAFYVGVLR
jgi:outer membrane protein insertion porin family